MHGPQPAIDPAQFIHVRMVLSMIVSLALARLLARLTRFVQPPKKLRVYVPRLLGTSTSC